METKPEEKEPVTNTQFVNVMDPKVAQQRFGKRKHTYSKLPSSNYENNSEDKKSQSNKKSKKDATDDTRSFQDDSKKGSLKTSLPTSSRNALDRGETAPDIKKLKLIDIANEPKRKTSEKLQEMTLEAGQTSTSKNEKESIPAKSKKMGSEDKEAAIDKKSSSKNLQAQLQDLVSVSDNDPLEAVAQNAVGSINASKNFSDDALPLCTTYWYIPIKWPC